MKARFLKRIAALKASFACVQLKTIKRGFEKESLRVNSEKKMARTSHPRALGSNLMHPNITTDYSEALLEFITPPSIHLEEPLEILHEIHQFTYAVLKKECLWAASMPCLLEQENDIPIAEYGTSNYGRLKNVYRRGLGHRYGRKMQTIAGLHYNFSLSNDFWSAYQTLLESNIPLQDFISEQYLSLIRNCFRYGWLLPLLFGASPALSDSFFKTPTANRSEIGLHLLGKETFIAPYATSLRLSDLGYHNPVQATALISYNSFEEFLTSLKRAVQTRAPEYEKLGVQKNGQYQQLNTNILQVEDEHYALIRPKRVAPEAMRMLKALQEKGIEYIELRALDIDPLCPLGIGAEDYYFLDAFLVMCLLMDSPPLTSLENKHIEQNIARVAKEGRRVNLLLEDEKGEKKPIEDWALELFELIESVASLLDTVYQKRVFSEACQRIKQKLQDTERLPSSRVLQGIQSHGDSFIDFAWHWSLQHQAYFLKHPLSSLKEAYYKQLAEDSLQAQKMLESQDKIPFDLYLKHFLEL